MATMTNPSDIARETLRLLAARRVPPTPDNYLMFYHEVAGSKPVTDRFPEKHLQSLAAALPRTSPDQLRLARQLEEAVKNANWKEYQDHLIEFITVMAESQKLAWAALISDLIHQWDAKYAGLTTARKREALEHILNSTSAGPEVLFNRLQNLMRAWENGGEPTTSDLEPAETGPQAKPPLSAASSQPTRTGDLLPELRELFAYTLETSIATQLLEAPELSAEAHTLGTAIRGITQPGQLQSFLPQLKRFAFRLELLAEDQAELRRSLLNLLRLLVENITELVINDHWLHGQIEIVRSIIDKPLSQRTIDDAERRLKEVIYKQSQLKHSLLEAQTSLKNILAGFVDHLAEFAGATSDYHDKIEACAARISAANDITTLENVLSEVMRDTRAIQLNAMRYRDELRMAQNQAKKSEERVRELEQELEASSSKVKHDYLTGALNRHGLEEILDKELARARRNQTNLCLGLLDLDNFKKLNDQHGHGIGDAALVHLTKTIRETLRPQDTVARYGGEEFVVIFPESKREEAVVAMTRVQRELTRHIFMHDNQKILITFSAGIAQMRPSDTRESLTTRADEAMYRAKKTGKNKVEISD